MSVPASCSAFAAETQRPAALAENFDGEILGGVILSVADLDDVVVLGDGGFLRLDHPFDHRNDIGGICGRLEIFLIANEIERARHGAAVGPERVFGAVGDRIGERTRRGGEITQPSRPLGDQHSRPRRPPPRRVQRSLWSSPVILASGLAHELWSAFACAWGCPLEAAPGDEPEAEGEQRGEREAGLSPQPPRGVTQLVPEQRPPLVARAPHAAACRRVRGRTARPSRRRWPR